MNRRDFQILARIRIREARTLLNAHNFEGAYYLAGYAVECGLKACISKKTKRFDFPDKNHANKGYSHDLSQLVEVAGLAAQLRLQETASPQFALNWTTVKDWREDKRYAPVISPIMARELYTAITAKQHGVMRWIRSLW